MGMNGLTIRATVARIMTGVVGGVELLAASLVHVGWGVNRYQRSMRSWISELDLTLGLAVCLVAFLCEI
jgi:hypothetical protein